MQVWFKALETEKNSLTMCRRTPNEKILQYSMVIFAICQVNWLGRLVIALSFAVLVTQFYPFG